MLAVLSIEPMKLIKKPGSRPCGQSSAFLPSMVFQHLTCMWSEVQSMCSVIWSLHPSRSHFQPPIGLLRRPESHFSLAGLRSQQRAEVADSIYQ